MFITDAQVHVWNRETPDRPWPSWGRRLAHGDEFTPEALLAEMDATGVDRAILVPPSWEGDRNDTCLAGAAAHPDRFRVMGRLDVTAPAERDRLAGWTGQPGLLGFRVSFLDGQLERLHDGSTDWFWPAAEAAGVPLMCYLPRHVPELEAVVRAHPGLRIVVDHFALREGMPPDAVDPVVDQVVRLAKYPAVAVKASGLPGYAAEPYPFPSLHDRIRRVVDAFGPHRVFWGSDLSRMRCGYAEVRDLFTESLDFLSGPDLDLIMGRAVCDWLHWD